MKSAIFYQSFLSKICLENFRKFPTKQTLFAHNWTQKNLRIFVFSATYQKPWLIETDHVHIWVFDSDFLGTLLISFYWYFPVSLDCKLFLVQYQKCEYAALFASPKFELVKPRAMKYLEEKKKSRMLQFIFFYGLFIFLVLGWWLPFQCKATFKSTILLKLTVSPVLMSFQSFSVVLWYCFCLFFIPSIDYYSQKCLRRQYEAVLIIFWVMQCAVPETIHSPPQKGGGVL